MQMMAAGLKSNKNNKNEREQRDDIVHWEHKLRTISTVHPGVQR